jgi:RimJ/RimL family protein N-acetyltransferase
MLAKTRITAGADPRNLASVRLLERMGMTRTAYVRAYLEVRGELVDDVRYAVRKDDYLTIR